MKKCPSCHTENQDSDLFCKNCGQSLNTVQEDVQYCANCGARNPKSSLFCSKCGHPLSRPAGQTKPESSEAPAKEHPPVPPVSSKAASSAKVGALKADSPAHADSAKADSSIKASSSVQSMDDLPFIKPEDLPSVKNKIPGLKPHGDQDLNGTTEKPAYERPNQDQAAYSRSAYQNPANNGPAYDGSAYGGSDYANQNAGMNQSYGSAPVQEPRKKSIWPWIGLGAAIIVLAGAGFMLVPSMIHQDKDPEGTIIEEDRDYLVLNNQPYMDDAYSDTVVGQSKVGDVVHITRSVANNAGDEWGETEDGSWIAMSDPTYTYLTPVDTVSQEGQAENKTYLVSADTDVYAIADDISEPLSTLQAQDQVYVYETTKNGTEKWGRIAPNQWVLLESGDNIFAKAEEDQKSGSDSQSDSGSSSSTDKNSSITTSSDSSASSDAEESSSSVKYKPGNYRTLSIMKVRSAPGLNAPKIGNLQNEQSVYLADVVLNDDLNGWWGEIETKGSGRWVCIEDDREVYLLQE